MNTWHLPDRVLSLGGRALVMGIVNVTPDSFSDGGRYFDPDAAVAHGLALVEEGADLLDVGGESSRPGAAVVSAEEELRRVLPVVRALAEKTTIPLSIDTWKAAVADACLAAGAHIVNDITALGDPEMAAVVASRRAGLVLMHMQGTPRTMQMAPKYDDVVGEVRAFLEARLHAAAAAGIEGERVVLDPGIGFGKTTAHNLELLARLDVLRDLQRPVLLGVSRKGFLAKAVGRDDADSRRVGSLAAACHAVVRGAAQIVRVHDVRETRDAVTLLAALSDRMV